jgi:hypothetical protein
VTIDPDTPIIPPYVAAGIIVVAVIFIFVMWVSLTGIRPTSHCADSATINGVFQTSLYNLCMDNNLKQ